MSTNRRDFLKTGAVAAAATIAGPSLLHAASLAPPGYLEAPSTEPYVAELAAEALNAARDAGASYADVRIGRYRRQSISTRERQITGVSDSESYGLGIRTIVNGAWGFAATSNMTMSMQGAEMPCHKMKKSCPDCPQKVCPEMGSCLVKCFQPLPTPVSESRLHRDIVADRVAPAISAVPASSLIPPLLRPPSV